MEKPWQKAILMPDQLNDVHMHMKKVFRDRSTSHSLIWQSEARDPEHTSKIQSPESALKAF